MWGGWWDNGVMREDDGRKLSHATLEELRIRSAIRVVDEKVSADSIASALGLARSTVFGWAKTYREGGAEALVAKPVPGAKPKLDADQQRALFTMVSQATPLDFGFAFALWTRDLVRQLIKSEFDVVMSISAVGVLLHRIGLSVQRPLWRAWQQNADAVRQWKEETFPAIREAAAQVGGTVYFGDEAGLRSDFHAGTTWAPVGLTPVVRTSGSRSSVNMISAVTAVGAMRWATYSGSFTALSFIDFLKKLARDTPGPVFLIVDNHSVHRAKVVREYVDSTRGGVNVHRLPSYSPELNPDEWVWNNLKAADVGRASITRSADLKAMAISGLHRIQKLPALIQGFFRDPDLAYITA